MEDQKIVSVFVCEATEEGGFPEFYKVGEGFSLPNIGKVSGIRWGSTPGMHCDLKTVVVEVDGKPYAEFPFHNVKGVYFETGEAA